MGRKKEPQTLDEMRDEKEYAEKKKRQAENRIKILQRQYSREAQAVRTHHLCEEAGDAESMIPELKVMNQKDRRKFFELAFNTLEAQKFLQKWKEENETDDAEPDMSEDY